MGIDLCVKVLAVVSCGGRKRVFRNINRHHKLKRLNRQLKHHQRILARKKKGSRNRLKERIKVQKIYGRIKRIRHDYVHQTTRAIVNMKPQTIVLEDLNISGMMKNKYLAKSIAELLLSERTYKCPECGLIIDRDFNAARNLEKLAK